MSDRTLSMMEVHPRIIARNRFRHSMRLASKVLDQAFKGIERERLLDEQFLKGDQWAIGSVVNVRLPQRFQPKTEQKGT